MGADSGFWQKPGPWVWTVFLLAMLIFVCSMLTWREGQKFPSRQLTARERRLVLSALAFWRVQGGNPREALRLEELLHNGSIRALDGRQPRTFGYTDERGRILLNPGLCFAYDEILGKEQPQPGDLVATLATLYHEFQHLTERASEAVAYEREWELVHRLLLFCPDPAYRRQLQAWDQQLPLRVGVQLGAQELQRMRQNIQVSDELLTRRRERTGGDPARLSARP